MFLSLQMTNVFNLLSCMAFFIGNSLCVDILKSSCSRWEEDHDSMNNLDASVSLWERNDCPNYDCAILCDRDPLCRSFFHHPSMEKCLTSSSYKRRLPTDKGGQQGGIYYTKKQYCDEGFIFNQSLGLCYKVFLISTSFNNAMITCEEESAKLMTIKNEAEFRFIQEVMKEELATKIYLGFRAGAANGKWLVWDGKDASYLKWGVYQPDNCDGIESCVEMDDKAFNDIPCSSAKYFICQRFI